MEVGSIVLAPLNQKLWPGKIISLGMMAQIQFYKIKAVVRVPIKTLHNFTQDKVTILLLQYQDKAFVAAVKMAQKEFNESCKPYQEESKKKRDNAKNGKKTEVENLEVETQLRSAIAHQPMKKEEQEDCKDNEIVWASSVPEFILTLDQNELLSQVIENKPKQFCFVNSVTKDVQKYVREPRFALARLTQKLMRKLWFQQNKSKTLQIQKRIKTIVNSWDMDIKNILNCDFWKIIHLTSERREKMPWITESYIKAIQNFMEKMRQKISNKLDDYSDVGVIMNRVAGLQLNTQQSK